MSKAVKKFNSLNGPISKKALNKLMSLADIEGQTALVSRIAGALAVAKDVKGELELFVSKPSIEQLPSDILPSIDQIPGYISEKEFTSLNKAVSPDEIYTYITDLIINTIKVVGHLPWQREWEKTSIYNGYQALNFESKKGYRGINFVLTNYQIKVDENGDRYLAPRDLTNPYFLTFNQIKKNKGKLREGSKGVRVIYFTMMYTFDELLPNGKKLSFSSYNQKKFGAWLAKNYQAIQTTRKKGKSIEELMNVYIPILKYYNVFSGHDVDGIEWGEIPKNKNISKSKKERIEVAEAIVDNMPNPPKVTYKGDQPMYLAKEDHILMTPLASFNDPQSYYTTMFHEMVHATGHRSRLSRPGITLAEHKTKSDYAFEELIAEMGAVFLSSEAGILFKTLNNSAKYLSGWNKNLVDKMSKDNRFFFRASSRSQAAADYILDRDKDGIPKYVKTLEVKPSSDKGKESDNDNQDLTDPEYYRKDLSYDVLRRSRNGISFSPERRAETELKYWGLENASEYKDLLEKAKEEDFSIDELDVLFLKFYKKSLKLKNAEVSARSRLLSTMITGPANFPVRKARAASDRHHDIWGKYLQHRKYGTSKIISKIYKREGVVTGSADMVDKLQMQITSLEEVKKITKEFNKELHKKGASKEERQAYLEEKQPLKLLFIGFPNIGRSLPESRVKAAINGSELFLNPYISKKILDTKKRLKGEEYRKKEVAQIKESEIKYKGVELVLNEEQNRVQLIFEGKPSDELRKLLKSNAFRWSPKNGAWQRQMTRNGIFAARKVAKEISENGLTGSWHAKNNPLRHATDEKQKLKKGYKYVKGGKGKVEKIKSTKKNAPDPTPKKKDTPELKKVDFVFKKSKDSKYVVRTYHNLTETRSIKWIDIDIDTETEYYRVSAAGLKHLKGKYPNSYKEQIDVLSHIDLKKPQTRSSTRKKKVTAAPKNKVDKTGQYALLGKPETTKGDTATLPGGSSRPGVSSRKNRFTASDIMDMEFTKMDLPQEWGNLFPDAPEKIHLAFMGKPKNGKSVSACQWGAQVGKNKKILYNFADQGIISSTKKILQISGLSECPGLTVTAGSSLDELERDIIELSPDYVFIDMINDYIDKEGIKPVDFKKRFIESYPDVSFNLIFEATKNGDFKGDQKWTHLVDQLITIEDYIMYSKGRYGSGERIIWDEGAQKRNPALYDKIKSENSVTAAPQENRAPQGAKEMAFTFQEG